MAKVVALASALYILALAAISNAHNNLFLFNVEGDVYCDPCRVQFETELSQKLVGATVRLECRHADTKTVIYSLEGITGPNGHYNLSVVGDHGDEICEVSVVNSPNNECNEPLGEKSRVVLSNNDGMHSTVRIANAIGFQTKTALPQCGPVLFNMGVVVESR
ncbi:pollen Ole e 1 allergen and extensin family protein [Striga asiatica]|uniref:Pollen Ole e 1 allergen and extensin family protein n=1 Tax=Striga asiatica TaxID=4170 RepID=A0A5A7P9F6_STRAF|nr:pollen Ole e 1 allergen and extensin family protein [Striga asiatica]